MKIETNNEHGYPEHYYHDNNDIKINQEVAKMDQYLDREKSFWTPFKTIIMNMTNEKLRNENN